jgi:Transposase DDE domain
VRRRHPHPREAPLRRILRQERSAAAPARAPLLAQGGVGGQRHAEHAARTYNAAVLRPARQTEPDNGLHLSGIRQRIESIFWTLKDQLGLETHRARTLRGLRARIASKLLAYSAGIWLNWLLGRPTRTFSDLTT